ncbi:hypothetical protein GOODEAATRI_015789 [Goodea atripinnis]|uniref:Uncharacterized protein n=1 Tax=Goodea atripinnis TaxID=208336 RepID=A0ABV0NBW3_9TELE
MLKKIWSLINSEQRGLNGNAGYFLNASLVIFLFNVKTTFMQIIQQTWETPARLKIYINQSFLLLSLVKDRHVQWTSCSFYCMHLQAAEHLNQHQRRAAAFC